VDGTKVVLVWLTAAWLEPLAGNNHPPRKLRRHEVLDSGDVDDGAFNEAFRQPIGVRIQSDFDGIAFDESRVVIGDVKGLSIRQTEFERAEWLAVHPVFELLRIEHILQG
jgi:hypothetical protein